jgi:sec-independent protein translocase protein TatC
MKELKANFKKYLPYLEDIQKRFYFSFIIILGVFLIGVLSSGLIIKNFIKYFNIDNVILTTTSPLQFADVAINIGFFCAIIVALPLFIYNLLSFSYSALNKKELQKLLLGIFISLLLFVFGFIYGFFILFYSFSLLAVINESLGIKNIWDISIFLSQIIMTSSLLGIIFQFPLVLSILIKIELFSLAQLKAKRRLVIIMLFILTALLPPTDGLSLIAMALPLYILYELTIIVNYNK